MKEMNHDCKENTADENDDRDGTYEENQDRPKQETRKQKEKQSGRKTAVAQDAPVGPDPPGLWRLWASGTTEASPRPFPWVTVPPTVFSKKFVSSKLWSQAQRNGGEHPVGSWDASRNTLTKKKFF